MGGSSAEGEVDRHEMLVGQSLAWLGRNFSIVCLLTEMRKLPCLDLLLGGHFRLLGVFRPFLIAEEGVREIQDQIANLCVNVFEVEQGSSDWAVRWKGWGPGPL